MIEFRLRAANPRSTVNFTFQRRNDTIEEQAEVAQLVEQLIRNQQVIGSSPIFGSSFIPNLKDERNMKWLPCAGSHCRSHMEMCNRDEPLTLRAQPPPSGSAADCKSRAVQTSLLARRNLCRAFCPAVFRQPRCVISGERHRSRCIQAHFHGPLVSHFPAICRNGTDAGP
jgi:hypothetical protein